MEKPEITMIVDSKMRSMSLKIPEALYQEALRVCHEKGITVSDLTRLSIRHVLGGHSIRRDIF